MSSLLDLATVARLVGDPTRLKMLAALLDEGELSAGELAAVVGVSPQTASAHLGKLQQGGLITRASSAPGARCRFFRLTDDDVARAVAALVALAAAEPQTGRVTDRREATVCYGHLGGALGSALLAALLAQGLLEPGTRSFGSIHDYRVTTKGGVFLNDFGIDTVALRKRRRYFARRCLNTHEAAAHLSGSLGEALLEGLLERRWIVQQDGNKPVVQLTEVGRLDLPKLFGVKV